VPAEDGPTRATRGDARDARHNTTRQRSRYRPTPHTHTHIISTARSVDNNNNNTNNNNNNTMLSLLMRNDHPLAVMDAMFDDALCALERPHDRSMVRRDRGVKNSRIELGRPRIEETSRGYLITAHAPGIAAKDVTARVTRAGGRSTLRVEIAGGSAPLELGLPTKYVDVTTAPKASCIDGVLRVAVLKREAETLRVPIAATADTDMETDDGDNDSSITLSVPGFSARDISVTLHKPEDSLVVEGDSTAFGKFKKTFKNLPADIELKHISASVAHGLLKITMADPHAIEPLDIAVSNLESDATTTENSVTLVRRYVPGVSSDNVTCRLGADRMLHVEVKTPNGRAALSTSVSKNVDHTKIRATCTNGVLLVVAEPQENESHSHTLEIHVSGEHPAAIAELMPSAVDIALPAAEKPAEVEDFDGKVEDVAA